MKIKIVCSDRRVNIKCLYVKTKQSTIRYTLFVWSVLSTINMFLAQIIVLNVTVSIFQFQKRNKENN